MAQTIKLKRSSTAGSVPSTSSLSLGEVAINTYDGKMYIKKNDGTGDEIIQIGAGNGSAVWTSYDYTATSSQTSFSGADNNSLTLSYVPGFLQVFLNGVLLDPAVDYAATTGNSVVLTVGATTSDLLQIETFTQIIGTGDILVDTFPVSSTQTAFTLSQDPINKNNISVYVEGVYQESSTYSLSTTTLTLSESPANGTTVEVVIGTRNVTLDGIVDLTISGTLHAGALDLGDANIINVNEISLDTIKGDADANTNITFAGSDVTTFTQGGTERLRLNTTGAEVTGNIVVSGTVDGRDVAADGATADAALPRAGGAMGGPITTNSTFDGRDVSVDGTKLDGIESGATADQTDVEIRAAVESASDSNVFTNADHNKLDAIEALADVTDATNVTAAGALMDSEVTNLAQVKAFDSSDYATAAQGTTADAALPKAGGTMSGELNMGSQNITNAGTIASDTIEIDTNANGNTHGVNITNSALSGAGSLKIAIAGSSGSYSNGATLNDIVMRNETSGGSIIIAAPDSVQIGVGGSDNQTRFTVNSSGNVGIGTDSPGSFYPGAEQLVVHRASGEAGITVSTANNTNGALYFADGTTSSQAYMGGMAYAHTTDVLTLVSGGVARVNVATAGHLYPNVNNTMDLGLNDKRWKDLYLSNLAYVGGLYNTGIYNQQSGDIQFWVTNVGEAVRIQQNTGNVGIGTTAPLAPLDVVRGGTTGLTSVNARTALLVQNNLSNGTVLSINAKNTGYSGIFLGDQDAEAVCQIQYNHVDDKLKFLTNGGGYNPLTLSGQNVGIGTSSPDYLLDIENTSGHAMARLHSGTNGSSSLRLQNDAQHWDVNLQTNDKFAVYDHTAGTQPFTIMPTTGNVGIGTSTPGVKLEIGQDNSSTSVGYIRLRGHNTIEGNIYKDATYSIHMDSNSNNGPIRIDGSKQILGITGNVGIGTETPSSLLTVAGTSDLAWSAATSKLQISRSGAVARLQNYESGSASTNLALQWEGGNVGIGTTSPYAKLHVDGAIMQSPSNSPSVSSGTGNSGIDLYTLHNSYARGSGRLRVAGMENNQNGGYAEYYYTYATSAGGTIDVNLKFINEAYVGNTYARPRLYLLNSSTYNASSSGRQNVNQTASSTNSNILEIGITNVADANGVMQIVAEPFHWN